MKLARLDSKSFGEWLDQNVFTHRNPDYAAVTISLKGIGEAPGDASDSAANPAKHAASFRMRIMMSLFPS